MATPLERRLPATRQASLRLTLEGLLCQETDGADVSKRILEVCGRLEC